MIRFIINIFNFSWKPLNLMQIFYYFIQTQEKLNFRRNELFSFFLFLRIPTLINNILWKRKTLNEKLWNHGCLLCFPNTYTCPFHSTNRSSNYWHMDPLTCRKIEEILKRLYNIIWAPNEKKKIQTSKAKNTIYWF